MQKGRGRGRFRVSAGAAAAAVHGHKHRLPSGSHRAPAAFAAHLPFGRFCGWAAPGPGGRRSPPRTPRGRGLRGRGYNRPRGKALGKEPAPHHHPGPAIRRRGRCRRGGERRRRSSAVAPRLVGTTSPP
eukprot:13496310-Alexandrium_andersonii.AAC.1